MVLSSRLANRIGVRRPNVAGAAGAARGSLRRPVQDAREVLNARGVRGSANGGGRRLGVAGGGIVKTGRSPNLRLNTLRAAGRGGLRSDRMAAAVGRVARPVPSSARFSAGRQAQASTFRQQGGPLRTTPRGLVSFSQRMAAVRRPIGIMDDDFPQSLDKEIRVDRNGILVTTANNLISTRRNLLEARGILPIVEEEDDLERMTLDDVLGKGAAVYRPPAARSTPTALNRILHRLDGGSRAATTPATTARRAPSEPLQGVSVLVANLDPQVTETDIRDLFQDIGPMQDARMVAVGTALATFHRQSDAVKAFKAYHGRLLDGRPMNLTVLTLSTLQLDQR
uniref:Putative dna polymerase delta n=1 Tax=Ixodes ricinus TaxID=34613 RepID=V5HTU7_IXORI